jgi:hypothetical protein
MYNASDFHLSADHHRDVAADPLKRANSTMAGISPVFPPELEKEIFGGYR